jgi:hypothetical protein
VNRSDRLSLLLVVAVLVTCAAALPGQVDANHVVGTGSVTGAGPQAIRTTLCELARSPELFQGRVVEVRAIVQTGFATNLLRDDTCSTFIWLSGLDTTQSSSADATNEALRKDRQFRKMQEYLDKKYQAKTGPACSRCPLYKVTATVVGRFEHVRKVNSDPKTGAVEGFGYMNSYDSQLVLLAVSNVVAETIDRSASENK